MPPPTKRRPKTPKQRNERRARAAPRRPAAPMTVEGIVGAVVLLSRAVDKASLKVLRGAHQLVQDRFLAATAAGRLDNAAEQRVLGALWAELEMAVDERGLREH